MKLTIFGATGGIGGQILEQAVAAGHEVTAAAHGMLAALDRPGTIKKTIGIAY